MRCRWLETSVQSAPWGRIFMIWKVGCVAAADLLFPKTWPRPAISPCSFECSMRLWSRLRRLWWPPGSWAISLVNGRPMPFWVRSGTRFVNVLEKKHGQKFIGYWCWLRSTASGVCHIWHQTGRLSTLQWILSLIIVEVPDECVIRPQAMKLVKEMAKAVEQRDADAYQKASVKLAAYLKFSEGTAGDKES